MSVALASSGGTDRGDVLRWGVSLAVVLALHIAGTILLTAWEIPVDPVEPPPAAVMIELAPLPAAPAEPITDIAPGPEQTEAQPAQVLQPELDIAEPLSELVDPAVEIVEPTPSPIEPEPLIEPPPTVEPLLQMAEQAKPIEPEAEIIEQPIVEEQPKPKPKPAKQAKREQAAQQPKKEPEPDEERVEQTTAPPTTPAPPSQVAAAPAPGAQSMQPSNAQVTWEGAVLAQLERHKRYPRAARRRSQEGVPSVIIRINRQGEVLSVRLSHSSGFAMLDEEATALPERASPLPPPPPDMAGDPFEFTVPVQFFLN
jgi:protein TonB